MYTLLLYLPRSTLLCFSVRKLKHCCAVLCCAVLCCAVLCCAVLCCAVLCCAVLRHSNLRMHRCQPPFDICNGTIVMFLSLQSSYNLVLYYLTWYHCNISTAPKPPQIEVFWEIFQFFYVLHKSTMCIQDMFTKDLQINRLI